MNSQDDKYDRLYEGEPWAALARQMGLRPSRTEGQARSALAFAAEEIAKRDKRIAVLESAMKAIGVNVRPTPPEAPPAEAELEGAAPEIVIDMIGGNCPVQAEGTIGGEAFYFRARGSSWSIGIGGEPVGRPDWSMEEDYGTGFDAGWMMVEEARAFIDKAARIWAAVTAKAAVEEDEVRISP